MKIAVLDTTGRWNIGNEFINNGLYNLLLDSPSGEHVNYDLVYFRQFESANERLNYPSDWMTKYNKKAINECDVMVMAGGSCLSKYHVKMFQKIRRDINIPIILTGASFYENIELEKDIYSNIFDLFDHVFARDHATYDALPDGNKHKSIDTAFWIGDSRKRSVFRQGRLRDYSVVNIDSPENAKMQFDLAASLKGDIWLSRNNPSEMTIFNSDLGRDYNVFVGETLEEYVRFYGHAKHVATNRVHTFLVCLLAGTPVQFCHDVVTDFARYFLFHEIGMKLDSTKVVTPEDFKAYETILAVKKQMTADELHEVINSYKK